MPNRTSRVQTLSINGHGTGALTTGSFTPNNNSLLYVVAFFIANTDDASEGTTLTITDSIGLTWTSRGVTVTSPNWSYGIRVWTAPVTTGASMTVSVDCGATNVFGFRAEVYDFTNYDTGTPAGATATGTDADGDGALALTLSGAPASASIVMAHLLNTYSAGTGVATPNAAWSELFDATHAGWALYQTQARTGSTSTAVNWDDILVTGTGGFGATALAVEILDAPAGGSPVGARVLVGRLELPSLLAA